jgi:hypothetical protein
VSRVLAFLLLSLLVSQAATAQSARTSAALMRAVSETKASKWSASAYYGVNSDFADNRSPRGYNHSLGTSVGYSFTKNLTTSASLGMRTEMIGGQIEKEPDKSYAETLAVNPSTAFSLSYSGDLWIEPHTFTVSGFAEPLWDRASRLEGYKAVAGTSAGLGLKFFDKLWTMTHSVSWSSVVNTYAYNESGQSNPDYNYGYSLSNSFRLYKTLKFSYTWGIRYTRYMDGFLGYSYSNGYGLSYAWDSLMVSLSYSAGGWTDDGEVSLWFIDDYRRVGSLSLAYSF